MSCFTEVDLDISTSDAEATVKSARIGWNGKLGVFKGVLWVGTMYQDLDQQTQDQLSHLVGGQWDLNRSFSVLAEFGFGKRESQMLNISYRF